MAGSITKKFRMNNARQFFESFSEASPDRVFVFIGRSYPWTDDANPPAPVDSVREVEYDVWRSALSMKKIPEGDITFGIPRINWTSGTVYAKYTANSLFHTSNFYVLTDDFHVYKCLDNNNGGASTSKPSGTSINVIFTPDGYKWKYIYSISASDALKFLTPSFMPVKTLTADDGSAQWLVQQAAKPGSIETVTVNTGGSGYSTNTGLLQSATNNTAILATGASATNGLYVNSSIYISSGTGAGQIRRITAYNGVSKQVTVDTNWTTNPDSTSSYIVSPSVVFAGERISNAVAYSIVTSGSISLINVLQKGEGYIAPTATIQANGGSGATLTAEISPRKGHGADAVEELYATNVILNVKTLGSEGNTFIVSNDFRTYGILVNPLLANNSFANSSVYSLTTRIGLSGASGTFALDERITGSTSQATARVVEYFGANTIGITDVTGTFTAGETITGNTSAVTATASIITPSAIKPYTGDVVYIENRTPMTRATDQQEDIKIVAKF